eukprot:g1323.t1
MAKKISMENGKLLEKLESLKHEIDEFRKNEYAIGFPSLKMYEELRSKMRLSEDRRTSCVYEWSDPVALLPIFERVRSLLRGDCAKFIDLGSGCGHVVFTAALCCPNFSSLIGVEIDWGRCSLAKAFAAKYSSKNPNATELSRTHFIQEDFNDSCNFKWSEMDCVWVSGTCYDEGTLSDIQKHAQKLRPGTVVVTYDKPLVSESSTAFKVEKWGKVKLSTTWEPIIYFNVRLNEKETKSDTWPVVGANCRIISSEKKNPSQKAVILVVNEVDQTADCIFETSNDGKEIVVPFARIQRLQSFENVEEETPVTALEYKERGNLLFSKFRDFEAAVAQYRKSLDLLRKESPCSVGSTILLKRGKRLVDADVFDVSVDEKGTVKCVDICLNVSNEEISDFPVEDVVTVVAHSERSLQIALHLNSARCHLNIRKFLEKGDGGTRARRAQWHCCVAIALAQVQPCDEVLEGKARALRARAQLVLGHLGSAARDARLVGEQTFERQVERKKIQQKKANRKLARQIGKWVETAIGKNENG